MDAHQGEYIMKFIKLLFLALLAMLTSVAWAPVAVPTTPALLSPANGATLTDPTVVTLTWRTYTYDPGGITGETIELSTSSARVTTPGPMYGDFVSSIAAVPVCVMTTTVYPPPSTLTLASYNCTVNLPAPAYGTRYYWHAQATDATGDSAWSSLFTFRVAAQPPTALEVADVQVAPAYNPDYTLRPVIRWTNGAQIVQSYTIQMSTDCPGGFSTIYRTITVSAAAIPANQYAFPTDLPANTTYCFRIRGNSTVYGTSGWFNAPLTYTTNNPPTAPILVSPVSGSVVNDKTPTFTWKPGVYVPNDPPATEFYTYEIAIYNSINVSTTAPFMTFCVADALTTPLVSPYTVKCSSGDEIPELGTITTTSVDVPDTQPLSTGTYYWRMRTVRLVGAEYQHSAWSSVFVMKIGFVEAVDGTSMNPGEVPGNVPGLTDPAALPAPIKDIPNYFAGPITKPGTLTGDLSDNVRLLSLRPKFSWAPGANHGQTFQIQVADAAPTATTLNGCNVSDPNSSTFSPLLINIGGITYVKHEYTHPYELPPNHILCWRVRPYNAAYGYGLWSDVQVFLTANPPTTPKGPFLPTSLLNTDNSPRLIWSQVAASRDSDPGTSFGKYEVEISMRSDFKGYTYPGNIVPPYDETLPIPYPLAAPIMPGNTLHVLPPATYPIVGMPLTYADCNRYPAISQAYDTDDTTPSPTFGAANDIDESWFHLYENLAGDAGMATPNGPLCGAHTYYWRVRAYNNFGEYSDWSTVNVLPITVDRPTNLGMGVVDPDHIDPTSLLPASIVVDSRAQELRPIFTWSPVYAAKVYRISILSGSFYQQNLVWGTAYQSPVDLPKNQRVAWQVVALDTTTGYGTSLSSGGVSFTTSNPPTAPKPVAPLGIMSSNYTPMLTWTQSFFTPSPAFPAITFDHYEIQLATNSAFTMGVINGSTPAPGSVYDLTFLSPALTPMSTYYWHVRGCDNTLPVNQCSAWSITYNYRTTVPPPTALLYTAPAGGGDYKPTFSWTAAAFGATSYTVLVSKYPSCSPTITSPAITGATVTGTTWTSTVNLIPGGSYYWCVRSNSLYYGTNLVVDPASPFVVPP
jgi:hypothetical protein